MNFSTMFKKQFFRMLFLMIWLLLCGGIRVEAASGQEIEMPDGKGDFLIVYSDHYGESAKKTVETIADFTAAMGKTADYGTVSKCTKIIEQYEYVICLNLDGETKFCQKLEEYRGNVLIIGSTFMAEYLEKSGYKGGWEEIPADKGQLGYTFSANTRGGEIVNLNGLIRCDSVSYKNGEIQSGNVTVPFCSQIADIRFIPAAKFETKVVKAALLKELSVWMWPYKDAVPDYAQYLVLDEVYPFVDARALKEQIDTMIEADVPFTISVMPILQNVDYPSVKEFCQVLSYAQKNGGAVILHAPIIHHKVEDIEELYEKLTDMTMAYIQQKVYPIGIEVPLSWLNDEIYLKVLERYRTVFVYDDGLDTGFSMDSGTSVFARQGHQTVMPAVTVGENGKNDLKCYSAAVYMDCGIEKNILTEILENSRMSLAPFMDLWNLEHSVWINDYNLNYTDGELFLNGVKTEITFEPEEYDENYDYKRRMIQRISVNLQNQNHVLMVIVVIVILIFLSFIIYARVRNRQQFLYKEDKKEE